MSFDFQTSFPAVDPACVANFNRNFIHFDWIDGESVVQAEQTPSEEGFNARFHKIETDLDNLGTDAQTAIDCLVTMRASMRALLDEIKTELNRASSPALDDWHDAAMLNNWRYTPLSTDRDYNRPGYYKDPFGIVHLRGTAGGGPIPTSQNGFNSVLFNLPPGYRPVNQTILKVLTSNNTVARIDIQTNGGEVNVRSPFSTWVSLDGLQFSVR